MGSYLTDRDEPSLKSAELKGFGMRIDERISKKIIIRGKYPE
jgi:hypothetical protein